MTEGACYQQKKTSPTALAVVVLMHGAALTALALAKMDNPARTIFGPTTVDLIEAPKEPPEVPPEPVRQKVEPQQPTVLTPPAPVFKLPTQGPVVPWTPQPTTTLVIPEPGPIVVPRADPPVAPVEKPRTVEPARAKANLASYVSDEDYPTNAVRNEEQGTTRFRLAVGPDGKVKECTVTSSSGSPALDSTTCKLMKQRAKFTPAKNNRGELTSDTVTSAIRWMLPSD
ncbi:MAG TPA: TonB family protein [Allosphingosinicella sp.]|jgi:protein TonB